MPGPKPTATIIKLARGNPGKRPLPQNEPVVTGAPVKPKGLTGLPSKIWDEFIPRMYWITWADGPKAELWCHLQAEVRTNPHEMVTARIAQWRALGSELGLDPGSRARLGTVTTRDAKQNKETVESEFFDRHKRN
jgi:hypothetical protein